MAIIRYSIKNPLIVNLILMFVLIAGVMSWYSMPQEMFPVILKDQVKIVVRYDGATPEDVEREITIPVEEAFDALGDKDFIRSTSSEGLSTVVIKLKAGANVDEFMRLARSTLDQITTLPAEADKPELSRLETRFPVISIAVYGAVNRATLFLLADKVKDSIREKVPGVATIGVAGKRDWELWVVVNPSVLASSNVSLKQIASALRANLKDTPGGSVKAQEGDILLRGKGQLPNPENIKKIVIKSKPSGGQLLLGEVAEVKHRLSEAKTLGRFNKNPSVNLTVSKTSKASTIQVAKLIRNLVIDIRKDLPKEVTTNVFGDMSVFVENRLNTVKSSGLVGLVFVLLSLYIFLNFRVALVTAMGIPVAFLVAVIALNFFGFSINMVSMFAFLIALGMIVDDAIIVNENVYRHMEMGESPEKAASLGAREVFWPVVASTITTIAAFLPMFSISGTLGAFVQVIPVVVTAALVGSLFEAFGVLPSHAAEILKVKKKRKSRINWQWLLERYISLLRWSVLNRYIVTALTIGALVVSVAYYKTRMSHNLFSKVDVGQYFINIEAPNTYSLKDSERLAKRVEEVIFKVLRKNEVDTVLTNVGFSFIDFNRFKLGSRYIQLMVNLKKPRPEGFIEKYVSPLVSLKFEPWGTRTRTNKELLTITRTELLKISGIERLYIARPIGGPVGADIEVGIAGPDIAVLRKQAIRLTHWLEKQPGVFDYRHDMDPGKRQYSYAINERGQKLGLTQKQISEFVRNGFLGLEVVYVTRDNKRMPVRLIFNEKVRKSSDLKNLQITLPGKKPFFLGDVASIKSDQALNTINRRDRRRLAIVKAEVNPKIITSDKIVPKIEKLFETFLRANRDYKLIFLGEKKRAAESFAGMKKAMILSFAIIFFVLAALFRSLLDPFVIMLAIPFGFIGVIIGHEIFSYNISFLSMVGFVALAGIVVNDSLILIDFAKKQRARGVERCEALIEAGRVRIRPILLTSITTFLGISPLIFFASGQTAFLSPMAVSLGFGLLFATVLILVSLPCFYLIADDLREWTKRLFGIKARH